MTIRLPRHVLDKIEDLGAKVVDISIRDPSCYVVTLCWPKDHPNKRLAGTIKTYTYT